MFEDIDANIQKLLEGAQDVKYHEHIGGGHYVSVTTGFRCVDFRRWFLPHDEQEPKPTKKGVALCLDEWAKMRNIVETINDNHPSLASAIPCYLQEDHQNQSWRWLALSLSQTSMCCVGRYGSVPLADMAPTGRSTAYDYIHKEIDDAGCAL